MLTMKAIAYKDLQSLTIVSCVIAGIGWWEWEEWAAWADPLISFF